MFKDKEIILIGSLVHIMVLRLVKVQTLKGIKEDMKENSLLMFNLVFTEDLGLWGMVANLFRRAVSLGAIENIMAVQEGILVMEISLVTRVVMGVLMVVFLGMVKAFSHRMEIVSLKVVVRRIILGMATQTTNLASHLSAKYVIGGDTLQLIVIIGLTLVIQVS